MKSPTAWAGSCVALERLKYSHVIQHQLHVLRGMSSHQVMRTLRAVPDFQPKVILNYPGVHIAVEAAAVDADQKETFVDAHNAGGGGAPARGATCGVAGAA